MLLALLLCLALDFESRIEIMASQIYTAEQYTNTNSEPTPSLSFSLFKTMTMKLPTITLMIIQTSKDAKLINRTGCFLYMPAIRFLIV